MQLRRRRRTIRRVEAADAASETEDAVSEPQRATLV
jgi:hypothetical protein